MIQWWIRMPNGLAQSCDLPELTIDAAIDRGWHFDLRIPYFPRVWLLLPNPEKFLTCR